MAQIPENVYETTIEIKKSQFIGRGIPIESPDDARAKIKEVRMLYPDARHVCYAFVCGENSPFMGMSDDGEPHGTAGRPMLEVVKGSGVENVLVTVVRYFGGIKLGTGGLVKAYTEITQEVFLGLPLKDNIPMCSCEFSVPYNLYEQSKLICTRLGDIDNEDFATDIQITLSLPEENRSQLEEELKELSNGKIYVKTL